MKKIILLIFIVLSITGFTQNLVQNPSFEQYNFCPTSFSQISWCQFWDSFSESPDYFNTCSTNNDFKPPNCFYGFQYPNSGDAYAGFCPYHSLWNNSRELLGSQLSSSLIIGQKYFISFYVNLAGNVNENVTIGINKLGAKFSTIPYSFSDPAPINNIAHFYSNDIITDTVKWTKISGSFIADSAYNYIMIGNFFTDSLTDTIMCHSSGLYAYYYIDDVCVSTDSLYCENWLGIKQNESKSEELTIYPNPAKDKITISSNGEAIYFIRITDFTGKEIYKSKSEGELNTSRLLPGTYIINVTTISNSYTKKLVIIR